MKGALVVVALLRWVWVFTLLIGTSYVVFWLGHSGWWFVLALLLMSVGDTDEKKK